MGFQSLLTFINMPTRYKMCKEKHGLKMLFYKGMWIVYDMLMLEMRCFRVEVVSFLPTLEAITVFWQSSGRKHAEFPTLNSFLCIFPDITSHLINACRTAQISGWLCKGNKVQQTQLLTKQEEVKPTARRNTKGTRHPQVRRQYFGGSSGKPKQVIE